MIIREKRVQQGLSFLGDPGDADPAVFFIINTLNQALLNQAVHNPGNIGTTDQHQLTDLILFAGFKLEKMLNDQRTTASKGAY